MILYLIAIGFIKLSILILCLRLFQIRRGVRIVIWIQIVVVAITTIATPFLYAFSCTVPRIPEEMMSMYHQVKNTRCKRENGIILLPSWVNLVTDVVTLVIPCWLVWGLQLPKRRRWGILAVLGTGAMYVIFFSLGCLLFLTHRHREDLKGSTPTDENRWCIESAPSVPRD